MMGMKNIKLSILTLLALVFISEYANAGFYNERARGWFWYEKEKKEKIKKEVEEKKLTPTEEIEAITKDTEKKLHQAIVKPTFNNIKKFRDATDKAMNMSEKFAYNFKRFIFMNPEYNSELDNPASHEALRMHRVANNIAKQNKIKELTKTHGLIYFFEGSCPKCVAFAKDVKYFSKKYNWEVMAISLDGVLVEEFPEARMDNGIADNLGIKVVPTLVAVNPKNNEVIPLAHGYIAQDAIEDRVDFLIENGKLINE